MNTEQQQPDGADVTEARASARRRLIRGSFAAPAILALHSGRAFAQATGAAACLVKQNSSPVTPAPTPANGDDGYFRYQLWVIRRISDNAIVSSWVKGADLAVYIRNGLSPFLASGSWWRFNINNNRLITGGPQMAQPTTNQNQTFTQTGAWVVLRVASNGQLVGAGKFDSTGGTGGSPVGDSCWNSFALGTPP